MKINYSDGSTVENAVIVIWDDNHTERSGYFRAFWASDPNGTSGSTVIGYCSPGGSHRTIRATVAEVARMYPSEIIYRNGKPIGGPLRTFDLFWSPEGKRIATVRAYTAFDAIRMAPQPYKRFPGEIYATEIK